MADFKTAATIGARISAIRKARGFRSAKDLADAIPGDTVSESILQNIEAGRKSDLAVSQLLNIAWALSVSPIFLLAPLGRPNDELDLPNLGGEIARLTAGAFDAWVAGTTDGRYQPRLTEERNERFQLESVRELLSASQELERMKIALELEDKMVENDIDSTFARKSAESRIAVLSNRIAELQRYLVSGGWQLDEDR